MIVALYTSAWIEILDWHYQSPCCNRRTLHECVDWNSYLLIAALCKPSRTLHECVDWNRFSRCVFESAIDVALYTSAWIEICWNKRKNWRPSVALYTSAWIEISVVRKKSLTSVSLSIRVRGLKFLQGPLPIFQLSSHSTRVRGLKYQRRVVSADNGQSHSTRVRGLKYRSWWAQIS